MEEKDSTWVVNELCWDAVRGNKFVGVIMVARSVVVISMVLSFIVILVEADERRDGTKELSFVEEEEEVEKLGRAEREEEEDKEGESIRARLLDESAVFIIFIDYDSTGFINY